MTLKAYLPEYNPLNLTGTVGGSISATQFSGYVNELFYHVNTAPTGSDSGSYQYRKIFIKNEDTSIYYGTKAWLASVEHADQITIQLASGLDTTTAATIAPVNVTGEWLSPSSYSDGILLGDLTVNSSTGLWIRQYLSGISEEDPYATFRLRVGGYKA
jgi:hypothetical protein